MNCVTISETPVTEDLEYGTEVDVKVVPKNPNASSITVMCAGGAFGFLLDNALTLARRQGVRIFRPVTSPRVGCLHLEPRHSLTSSTMMEICRAVSLGKINLRCGIAFGHLWATEGGIDLSDGAMSLNGFGSMRTVRFMRNLAVAEIRQVCFEPWAI
jgi:hypothetical protein